MEGKIVHQVSRFEISADDLKTLSLSDNTRSSKHPKHPSNSKPDTLYSGTFSQFWYKRYQGRTQGMSHANDSSPLFIDFQNKSLPLSQTPDLTEVTGRATIIRFSPWNSLKNFCDPCNKEEIDGPPLKIGIKF